MALSSRKYFLNGEASKRGERRAGQRYCLAKNRLYRSQVIESDCAFTLLTNSVWARHSSKAQLKTLLKKMRISCLSKYVLGHNINDNVRAAFVGHRAFWFVCMKSVETDIVPESLVRADLTKRLRRLKSSTRNPASY